MALAVRLAWVKWRHGPNGHGLTEAGLARIRSRFGAEVTEAAVNALRRRPHGSVRNPAGFAYRAAERAARRTANAGQDRTS